MKRKKNASPGLFSFVRVSFCRDSTPFNDVRGWHYKRKVSLLLSSTEKAKLMSFVTFFIKVYTRTRLLSNSFRFLEHLRILLFVPQQTLAGFLSRLENHYALPLCHECFFIHLRCKLLRPGLTALFFICLLVPVLFAFASLIPSTCSCSFVIYWLWPSYCYCGFSLCLIALSV